MSEEFNLENMSPAFKQAYELGVLRAQVASLRTSVALINEYVANWRTMDEDGRKRVFVAVEQTAAMQVYPDSSQAVIRTREDAAKVVSK